MAGERPDGGDPTPQARSSDDDSPAQRQPATDEGAAARDGDDELSGRAAFVAALRVQRNAKIGVAVGIALTVVAFVFSGSYRSLRLYMLGFVLALSTAGFVAFLLTLGRAVRLSREL